jgi:geranylgeranyl transferase type-2 subunit alpha
MAEFKLITDAIYTDAFPYAQSVWFYYQFLMTTVVDPRASITPGFTPDQRSEYVAAQLHNLRDMLNGAEDCKWIYIALLEYTAARARMQNRPPGDQERKDCASWLAELRKLDPFRAGRWDDVEKSLS